MFSMKGKFPRKILLVAELLLLAPTLALAGTPNLPDPQISAAYNSNVYEIDGPSTRWINVQPNPVPTKANPNAAEQVTSDYSLPGFLQMKSRSGLGSGLGVRVLADLPPIEFVDNKVLIRSNGISQSSAIRQFTAHSTDGSDVDIGLQMLGFGELGYRTVDAPADPYAFERILDAGVELEVILHRDGQAPVSIWSAGAYLIKSEDVDIPFAPFGDAPSWSWVESGDGSNRKAELTLVEYYENLFTVADGESFALEFSTDGFARNYEYPNWQSYADFFGTFFFGPRVNSPSLARLIEPGLQGTLPSEFYTDHVEATVLAGNAPGAPITGLKIPIQFQSRPPFFAPYVEEEANDELLHPDGTVSRYLRSSSGLAPLSGFGQVGAHARMEVQHNSPIPGDYKPFARADSNYQLSFVPVAENGMPEQIDLDFDLRLDGILQVEALDATAFNDLATEAIKENTHVSLDLLAALEIFSKESAFQQVVLISTRVYFAGHEGDAVFEEAGPVQLQDYFVFESIPGAGPQTGGRLSVDVNTQSLPANDPLVSSLQNVASIKPGDIVRINLQLRANVNLDTVDVSKVVRLDNNFLDTLRPELSTDTPGVTFELLDIPNFRNGFE